MVALSKHVHDYHGIDSQESKVARSHSIRVVRSMNNMLPDPVDGAGSLMIDSGPAHASRFQSDGTIRMVPLQKRQRKSKDKGGHADTSKT